MSNEDVLKIDGGYGEGGGQIIRTAVAISCLTGIPVEIENIRKNRKIPGLRPQHLTGINILEKICNARVIDASVGSTSIKFFPGMITDADLMEDIGTAGSISLIYQGLIPSVSIGRKNLNLSIVGGTDVPWSPTFYYTKFVLAEAYRRVGITFTINVLKRGYYPRGGGKILLKVFPAKKLEPIQLLERKSKDVKLFCSFSKIDSNLINKKVNEVKSTLEKKQFNVEVVLKEESALDKGGTLLLSSSDSSSVIGSDCLFDHKTQGFPNTVIENFIESNFGVDNFLSDMIVIPAALTNETSVFRVNKITKHLDTNLYVTSKITGCKYGVSKLKDGFEVRVKGESYS